MRYFGLGTVPLLVLVAWTAQGDDAAKDLKALQGVWQLVELEATKPVLEADQIKKVKFTVTDDKLVMEGIDGKREFALKLDPAQKPKAVDITSLGGALKAKTTPGLYELNGDTFKLCMANGRIEQRPKELKAYAEGQVAVFVLKRAK